MLKAYLNYSNSTFTAHGRMTCGSIRSHHKPNLRVCRVNIATLSQELQYFCDTRYLFSGSAEDNDMWFEIDFQDFEFESAVAKYIGHLVGQHYQRLADIEMVVHCLSAEERRRLRAEKSGQGKT